MESIYLIFKAVSEIAVNHSLLISYNTSQILNLNLFYASAITISFYYTITVQLSKFGMSGHSCKASSSSCFFLYFIKKRRKVVSIISIDKSTFQSDFHFHIWRIGVYKKYTIIKIPYFLSLISYAQKLSTSSKLQSALHPSIPKKCIMLPS